MKIALLGSGKTGSKILENKKHFVKVFNTANKPTLNKLKNFDVVISFLPGDAFKNYIPLLMGSKLPVVVGSTGFTWPKNFNNTLKKNKLRWIYASNFSIGMVLIKNIVLKISEAKKLFSDYKIMINETHHIHKKDKPSGTALSIEKWIDEECSIKSIRIGDVIGSHELIFKTTSEEIKVSHNAMDRKLFADGAIWSAEYILKNKKFGLYNFSDIVEKNFTLKQK